jgi:hypothetical protein
MYGGGIEFRIPDSRGRIAVTVATFYTSYCHQSPLLITLEKECVESKFTFSDKLSSRNETIHALFRWKRDRTMSGRSCFMGIPLLRIEN